jgi:putative peptidoglycan lipid II flippase
VTATSSAAPATPAKTVSTGRSSALIAAGILASRLLGLVRQKLIAHYLGAGLVAAAFNAAFRLTNLLQNLFGEGVLSASFIPVYANALARENVEEADRIAGAIGALLGAVVVILVSLGILAAPVVVKVITPGFEGEQRDLTILLTRILFPGAGLFVLGAWCLGVLNSHRRFFLAYAAPVVWSIAMIVALVAFGPRRSQVDLAVVVSWASVIGAGLALIAQLPMVFRLLHRPRFRFDHAFPPVRQAIRNFGPVLASRGVVQISGFIDIALASSIADVGAVALLSNAQTIYLLPISLIGMSVSAAEQPRCRATPVPARRRSSGCARGSTRRSRASPSSSFPRQSGFSSWVAPSSACCSRADGSPRRTASARGPSSPARRSVSSRAASAVSTRPPSTPCAIREPHSGSRSRASC